VQTGLYGLVSAIGIASDDRQAFLDHVFQPAANLISDTANLPRA
jgi:hypothetical protein